MPKRVKLIVAYDGTPFSGWQSQKSGDSIQDQLERALGRIVGQETRVHGAGRTDAGVHALAQCAHFEVPDASRLPVETWRSALNSQLPPAIRVIRASLVPQTFHARFSAKGKLYRYRIWNGPVLPPFEHQRAWHISASLNYPDIIEALRLFQGRHDFAAFSANRGRPERNTTVRTLEWVRLRRGGAGWTVQLLGDGVLYKMVRLIVGSLVQTGQGRLSHQQIANALRGGKVLPLRNRLTAPAHGLCLVRVRY